MSTILGDVTAEGDETFELLLSNAANATITTLSATGTIQDNEGPPVVDIAPATVEEAPGAELVFLVTLSGESAETIQVTWVATAGSATEGADFTAASGTLSWSSRMRSTATPGDRARRRSGRVRRDL